MAKRQKHFTRTIDFKKKMFVVPPSGGRLSQRKPAEAGTTNQKHFTGTGLILALWGKINSPAGNP
jgi:hypothetical protein